MGEGSGTHDSSKKSVLVSNCSGEVGGDPLRADGGSDIDVGAGNIFVGFPSSDADVGLVVPDDTTINGLSRGCLINGLEEGVRVSTSNGNFGLTKLVDSSTVGSPTSQSQSLLFDMHQHQRVLEHNCFSPLFELVFNSIEDDILLLNWVNPMGSIRVEEDWSALNFAPLAQWDLNGGVDLMTEEGDLDVISVEDDLEPSNWVSKMVKGFGKFVVFSIDSCERWCVDFFKKLEKAWEKQDAAGSQRRIASSSKKGTRELQNLVSTVNHDGQSCRRSKGIVKFSGLGSIGCPYI